MTAKELKKRLSSAGWRIIEGGRHELATHPDASIARPTHTAIIYLFIFMVRIVF